MIKYILVFLLIPTISFAQGVTVLTKAEAEAADAKILAELAAIRASIVSLEISMKASFDNINKQLADLTARVTKLEGGGPPTPVFSYNVTLTNRNLNFKWANIPNPTKGDWMAVYGYDEPNHSLPMGGLWFYADCMQYSDSGKTIVPTGECNMDVSRLTPYKYRAMLFSNEDFIELGRVDFSIVAENPPVLTYVEPPSNEVCHTSSESKREDLMWDRYEAGPTVEGYHVLVGESSKNYNLPLIPAGTSDRVSYNFMGIETRCFIVKGYIFQ